MNDSTDEIIIRKLNNAMAKQVALLYRSMRSKGIPIYDISEGRAEQVKINGKYPERDFDREKGENLSENDYSD